MFIAVCLTILLLSPCIVFIMFIIWLAHSLEGYPALTIFHANRDAVQSLRPLFAPKGSASLDTVANSRSTRARPDLWTASTAIARACATTKRNKTAAI